MSIVGEFDRSQRTFATVRFHRRKKQDLVFIFRPDFFSTEKIKNKINQRRIN